jgi:hypothetical protein
MFLCIKNQGLKQSLQSPLQILPYSPYGYIIAIGNNLTNHEVSNEELDNARQELNFCIIQITELEPAAKRIAEQLSIKDDNYMRQVFAILERNQWGEQYKALMLKQLKAAYKYIKLLERRIGK